MFPFTSVFVEALTWGPNGIFWSLQFTFLMGLDKVPTLTHKIRSPAYNSYPYTKDFWTISNNNCNQVLCE